jgi:hypothetical protein
MRLLHVRARTDADFACLAQALAAYSPMQSKRTLMVDLEGDLSEQGLLGVLSAIETCVNANDIMSVRVELDGRPYLLASQY